MGSYDSAGLGGEPADPGSSPHGFAAEETRSLWLLDDPGRGLPAPFRIVPAPLRRAGPLPRRPALVPVRLDPGAQVRARRLRLSGLKVWQEGALRGRCDVHVVDASFRQV